MRKKLKLDAERKHDEDEEEAELALERAARNRFESEGAKGKTRSKKPAALPVRKEDGSWALSQELDDDSDEEALGEPTPAALEKGKAEAEQAALAQEAEEKAAAPKRKAASQAAAQEPPQSQQQKLETIASLATTLLQSPEGSVNSIRTLLRYAADTDLVVARAGSISSMLVFKDLAPGYRIRPPTEKELEVTVSKEVQQLRKYENNFLAAYQSFLKLLLAGAGTVNRPPPVLRPSEGAGGAPGKGLPDRETSVRCMCGLLESLAHFNYADDLLNALVPWAGCKDPAYPPLVLAALQSVLEEDTRGESSLTVVQLVADLVRRRHCNMPPGSLALFLSLRFDEALLSELRAGAEDDRDGKKGGGGSGGDMGKKERSKKWIDERRKARDAAKSLEKQRRNKGAAAAARADKLAVQSLSRDAAELDAAPVEPEVLRERQCRQLEAVCEVYFRVLKDGAGPKPAPGMPLMDPALAGLGRIVHLLDFEVVTALLHVLCQLVGRPALTPALRSRVVLLAATVLSGQGSALTVDMRELFSHLYRLAECPPSTGPLHGEPYPDFGPEGAKSSSLWAATLQEMLLSRSQKHLQAPRLAAFAKRLGAAALHAEVGEAMGALAVARDVCARNQRVRQLLENDADCSGAFDPDAAEPEGAGALFAVSWELALLAKHAHPGVAAAAREMAAMPVGDAVVPPSKLQGSPKDIVLRFSTLAGLFQPPIPPRCQRKPVRGTKEPSAAFLRLVKQTPSGGAAGAAGADGASADTALFAPYFRRMREYVENARLRRELAAAVRFKERAAAEIAARKQKGGSGAAAAAAAAGAAAAGGAKAGKKKRGREEEAAGAPQAGARGGAAGPSGRQQQQQQQQQQRGREASEGASGGGGDAKRARKNNAKGAGAGAGLGAAAGSGGKEQPQRKSAGAAPAGGKGGPGRGGAPDDPPPSADKVKKKKKKKVVGSDGVAAEH